jgi:molybdate transport system substrate-binding protein
MKTLSLPAFFLLLWVSGPLQAESLLVAVATNFAGTMEDLGAEFKRQTGHELRLTSASTGVHYAQITNGAPFDLFFSADLERPRLLEEAGRIIPGTRFTYAVGQLVLWSADPGLVDSNGDILATADYRRIAVADAETAPYGLAAQQVLAKLGLTEAVKDKLITGTNIGQTQQFVYSRAVPLGFIAYSQLRIPGTTLAGSYWRVPQSLYDPIEQQAVMLRDSPAAQQFLGFLNTPEARAIIESYGYLLTNN